MSVYILHVSFFPFGRTKNFLLWYGHGELMKNVRFQPNSVFISSLEAERLLHIQLKLAYSALVGLSLCHGVVTNSNIRRIR